MIPFPLPRLVFDTPTPPPIGPTATPLPPATVTFNVRIPAATPQNSAPAVWIFDEVSGETTTVSLLNASDNVWTGTYATTQGMTLRYKYVRPRPNFVDELTAAGASLPYRLFNVTTGKDVVEDTVIGWSDTPFGGQTGALMGTVRNSNINQGVGGILVSVAGQMALTNADGSYVLYGVPVGNQRVNILAADGSLRVQQNMVVINVNQFSVLDFTSVDPNAIHVNFVVRVPTQTDAKSLPRLAGNLSQLGAGFTFERNGTVVASSRAPLLTQLADGRWAVRVLVYEGTVIRYRYTLGDGAWNGELTSDGARRTRQIMVPYSDIIVEDSVVSWHAGKSAEVTFEMTPPANTPATDLVSIQFRTSDWLPPLPMWRDGNRWKFVLYNPTNFDGALRYRYCRNHDCEAGNDGANRSFTPTLFPQDLQDTLREWRWFSEAPVPAFALPAEIPLRVDFTVGMDFEDTWEAAHLPFYLSALRELPATGADTATIIRHAAVTRIAPTRYSNDVNRTIPEADYASMVEAARSANINITLHPVTCDYHSRGICEYWNGVQFSPDFWNGWFNAYEQYILEQADLAQRTGTHTLIIGDFKLRPAFPGEPEAPADAETRWRSLISKVRARFGGRLSFELLMGQFVWPAPPRFLDSVDEIRVFWWSQLSDSNTPDVPTMAQAAGALMDAHLFSIADSFKKPVIISAAYLAATGAATQCIKDDAGNCRFYRDFDADKPDLPQHALDLQEQADIYNALLTAINQRLWLSGLTAFGYNPTMSLRDKSASVRGKPAEVVLRSWWLRMEGR